MNPANKDLVSFTSEQLAENYRMGIFLGFHRTLRLIFIPTDYMKKLYGALAEREIKNLESLAVELLECGHKRDDHISALQRVIEILKKKI